MKTGQKEGDENALMLSPRTVTLLSGGYPG
jgi:hypothetical protein